MRKAPYFICENHENAFEEMEKRNSEIKMRLKEENISEDDDGWIGGSPELSSLLQNPVTFPPLLFLFLPTVLDTQYVLPIIV